MEDAHLCLACLIWLSCLLAGYYSLGVYDHPFFSVGPGPQLRFMGLVVDEWSKWLVLMILQIVGTIFEGIMVDRFADWPRSPPAGAPEASLWFIFNVFLAYIIIFRCFSVLVMFTQIDITLATILTSFLLWNLYLIPRWLARRSSGAHLPPG
jgi:hypothetical protein